MSHPPSPSVSSVSDAAKLLLLRDIAETMRAPGNVRDALETVLERIRRTLPVLRGSVTLISPATGEIRSFIDPNDLTYASSITHFLQWAKQRDRQNEYFSLVITPGAFGYVNTLDQELTAAGFSRGKEILPSNDSRILEEEP